MTHVTRAHFRAPFSFNITYRYLTSYIHEERETFGFGRRISALNRCSTMDVLLLNTTRTSVEIMPEADSGMRKAHLTPSKPRFAGVTLNAQCLILIFTLSSNIRYHDHAPSIEQQHHQDFYSMGDYDGDAHVRTT